MTSIEVSEGGEWVAEFICGTNNIFNWCHNPTNNGDNVWEPELRVGENRGFFCNPCLGWGKKGKMLGTRLLGKKESWLLGGAK